MTQACNKAYDMAWPAACLRQSVPLDRSWHHRTKVPDVMMEMVGRGSEAEPPSMSEMCFVDSFEHLP